MKNLAVLRIFVIIIGGALATDTVNETLCAVRANTTAGWVCGSRRIDANGNVYASFRGVPYAKPPLAELRFAELQPAEPWSDFYNATVERDICPQTDIIYNSLMQPLGMSEDCIHANIHVPIDVLPGPNNTQTTLVPILLFVHGGAFECGSGDSDVYGPERLVTGDVIVITFNYRLNVFGFLSMNNTKIPGNNGLRDIITMLNWVKANAHYFGGNANDVTLAGHSSGATCVDLLVLSPAAQGLFNRAIILSGTSIANFYTTSPVYASEMAAAFLTSLGINSTDPDEIHQQLTQIPLENIVAVNALLQDQQGLLVFFPVVESTLPGIQTILPEDPFTMISKGYGKDIPMLIGYTNAESEIFRPRFEEIDIMARISANPLGVAPAPILYKFSTDIAMNKSLEIQKRYFNGSATLDKFIEYNTQSFFQYPALRVAKYRQKNSATTFLYEFSYEAVYSAAKEALALNFTGAGHIEDLTNIFQVNSVPLPAVASDNFMKNLMTGYILNFIKYRSSSIEEDLWCPINSSTILYQMIHAPSDIHLSELTTEQTSLLEFFDGILGI